jgi:hypothetical protein
MPPLSISSNPGIPVSTLSMAMFFPPELGIVQDVLFNRPVGEQIKMNTSLLVIVV